LLDAFFVADFFASFLAFGHNNILNIYTDGAKIAYVIFMPDKFPDYYLPMLASTTKHPFNDVDWQWEVKWDGYRMMCYKNENKINLRSRNNNEYTQRFRIIADELLRWKHDAILDGEMVVINEHGISHFNSLENWYSMEDGQLRYYVFDILFFDGKSLLTMPLYKRRTLLKKHFPKSPIICYNECFAGDKGIELFEKANHFRLEGIVGKHKESEYFPGARTKQWLKIKVEQWVEGIIAGFTKLKETDVVFSRLIIAIPDGKELRYIGAVGSGFTQRSYKEILSKLKVTKKSPFKKPSDPNKATRFRRSSSDIIYWVKPEQKCLIRYQ
jgi:bifunctional non-homologous end joining protein LigD